jgi:hypothetical protein
MPHPLPHVQADATVLGRASPPLSQVQHGVDLRDMQVEGALTH